MALLAMLLALSFNMAEATDPVLDVVVAVGDSGEATTEWLAILRKRLADGPYDSVSRIRRALTPAEAEWVALIRARTMSWERELSGLALIFEPVAGPRRVSIVLGNRGAHDAFTHDPTTIGFDVAALFAEYGNATLAENTERIDRLFRHEYVHLLQKAWLVEHPYDADSPLDHALAEIWAEGLGNYYSMSGRWRAANGVHSEVASAALATLEPRFAARLAALACTSPQRAIELTRDLSWGRVQAEFDCRG